MSTKNIIYKSISPLREDVQYLITQLDQHHLSHYPLEVCHLTQSEQLAEMDCVIIGAFDESVLCGMGAVIFFDDYAEITRMFVLDEYRGNRIANTILTKLIELVKERKLPVVKLETGEKFKAAVELYRLNGFEVCAPFGEYVNSAHNLYMQKIL